MLNRIGLFVCAFMMTTAMASTLPASEYPDSSTVRRVAQIQRLAFNDQFLAADSLCGELIKLRPNDPVGYVFRAEVMIGRMTDCEENLYGDSFNALIDSIESMTVRVLDTANQQTAAWMYLYRGNVKAYRSLYESRFGSFVRAVKLGMAAKSEYNDGLKADSGNYDLYFGLGSYHYWKSAKAGLLRLLFILKNEKNKGIEELTLVVDSSLLFRDAARSAMIWVWLNEKEYDSAAVIASEMSARYPDGKSFLWPMAEAYFAGRRYRDALDVYNRLRARLASEPGNYYNLIECESRICLCFEKLRLLDRAAETARRVSRYLENIPDSTEKRQRSNLKYLRKLARL